MACGKINVKPCNECVNEIVTSTVENEGRGEGKVRGCASVEIEG